MLARDRAPNPEWLKVKMALSAYSWEVSPEYHLPN